MIVKLMENIAIALDEIFPINLFVIDENGIISWADRNMLEVSGVTNLKTIEGKHASIFGQREWLTSERILQSQQREVLHEHYKDKDYFVIKVPYKKKNFMGILGLSIDITQLKQAERAKSIFTMNMGHDIRTPFCGIITVLELLYAQEQDVKKKELLEMSLYSSRRLLDFMNDIQEVSRLGHLPSEVELCDMKAMAENIAIFLTPSIQLKKLKIKISCKGRAIMMDRYRIEKILLNLLGNAVKFTKQGKITVSIKTSPVLNIVIRDTGIGIDEKHHEEIFEEFFKVVASYKNSDYAGIGKGLYLVKKYTEELNGTVTVKSSLGKGSVFEVTIPINTE